MIAIKRLSSTDADFNQRLDALLAFEAAQDASIEQTVADILSEVKARGDAAVIEYTRRFDALSANSMAELELSQNELQQALAALPPAQRQALE
ncbi:histidinol dehydrogenase, partial [Candidatus Accumulibacter vicinus]|uniref:histidinol dehydrogenase n=1 Tax=Candidatus Accumulibacter vicinus TaxID=2954382 RepID=UPI0005535BB0